MFLQDFQLMGGVFIPKQIVSKNEAKGVAVLRGTLSIEGRDFYIRVVARRGELTKITRVAASTKEGAVRDKKELVRIRAEGISSDKGGLRAIVSMRALRLVLWFVFFISYLVCLIVSGLDVLRNGMSIMNAGLFVICLLCLRYCMVHRNALIYQRQE